MNAAANCPIDDSMSASPEINLGTRDQNGAQGRKTQDRQKSWMSCFWSSNNEDSQSPVKGRSHQHLAAVKRWQSGKFCWTLILYRFIIQHYSIISLNSLSANPVCCSLPIQKNICTCTMYYDRFELSSDSVTGSCPLINTLKSCPTIEENHELQSHLQ